MRKVRTWREGRKVRRTDGLAETEAVEEAGLFLRRVGVCME
jgi:hypothetical protein